MGKSRQTHAENLHAGFRLQPFFTTSSATTERVKVYNILTNTYKIVCRTDFLQLKITIGGFLIKIKTKTPAEEESFSDQYTWSPKKLKFTIKL